MPNMVSESDARHGIDSVPTFWKVRENLELSGNSTYSGKLGKLKNPFRKLELIIVKKRPNLYQL